MASVVAVVFDVGETLIDETDMGRWADWLGVPRLTLFAHSAASSPRGHHSEALRMRRPGIDLDAEMRARDAAGHGFRHDRGSTCTPMRCRVFGHSPRTGS